MSDKNSQATYVDTTPSPNIHDSIVQLPEKLLLPVIKLYELFANDERCYRYEKRSNRNERNDQGPVTKVHS